MKYLAHRTGKKLVKYNKNNRAFRSLRVNVTFQNYYIISNYGFGIWGLLGQLYTLGIIILSISKKNKRNYYIIIS